MVTSISMSPSLELSPSQDQRLALAPRVVDEAVRDAARVVPNYVELRGNIDASRVTLQDAKTFAAEFKQNNPGSSVDLATVAGYATNGGRIFANAAADPDKPKHTIIHELMHGATSPKGEAWIERIGLEYKIGGANGTKDSLAEAFVERMAQIANPTNAAAYPHAGMGQLFTLLKGPNGESGFELMVRAVMNNDEAAQKSVRSQLTQLIGSP